MAVNIFTVFIALPSTILIWYYHVLFVSSKWCSRYRASSNRDKARLVKFSLP